ncbi:hypothetical protein H072_3079 [Dactylellina haptotyla CBS 200.50]|uniref:ARB-07466-like C-terminal domain-containing protein n=1 Tax=Dactylellina haptotyla (strain CBS 200.50) TaxID=1284197 RepID=S8AJ73_DACHA|nr:hypothetical protein H072_3079 [Dactylellina haptotyla CBS 200.50]
MKITSFLPIFLLASSVLACPMDDEIHGDIIERDAEIVARSAEPDFDLLEVRDEEDEFDGSEEGELNARSLEGEGELMARATCNNGAGSGVCANKSKSCSGGKYYAGFCPGSSAIQCCVKGTKLPSIPIGGCKKYVYTNGYKIMKQFPTLISNVGCKGSRAYKSDHAVGKALDFILKKIAPNPNATKMAEYIMRNYSSLKVKYIIWNGKIWNRERKETPKPWSQWRKYTPPKALGTNCNARHCNHIHVSFF